MEQNKTVRLRPPFGGAPFFLTGSELDQSIIGAIEYAAGEYEPHVMQLIDRVVRPDDYCVDVGANIGAITLVLSRTAGRGRVYAFEASAANYSYLVENLRQNRADNVSPVHVGLLDRTTDVEFCYVEAVAGCSFIPGNDVREGVIEMIHCVSLDEWAMSEALTRLDFVKLDAEGAEVAVLRGAERTLETFRPKLVVEFNPTPMQRFWQRSGRELYDLLTHWYSRIAVIKSDCSGLQPIRSYDELATIVAAGRGWEDLYCTP